MSDHIVAPRTYVTVFVILMACTAATVFVSTIDLGRLNAIVALSIAVTKAVLVLLYFMHLRSSARLTWLAVGAGCAWLAILILFTLSDLLTRGWLAAIAR